LQPAASASLNLLITILSKFSHNEIVNPKDLAEEFNVSVRTIQKDLKEGHKPTNGFFSLCSL
jgi:predicted DNA-binding transcriptional regulator YafY